MELTPNQHRTTKKQLAVSENNTHVVSFTTENLAVNSHYSITVTASNIAGEASSYRSISKSNSDISTVARLLEHVVVDATKICRIAF